MAAILVFSVTLLGCKEQKVASASAPPPADVNVATVVAKRIKQWDEFNGLIGAVESVEIRPRVTGHIERITFTEGDEVKRGDLLFVIDQRSHQAALDSAQAQLERANAASTLAKIQDQRTKALLSTSAISRNDADIGHAGYIQSQADARAAEAMVINAKLNVQYTEVRAPVSGRVGRALLTLGNLAVSDQTLLTTVVSQDPVYVHFNLDEHSYLRYCTQAHQAQSSQPDGLVRVGLANEQGYPHSGEVDFVDNKMDPGTGTIQVRAILRNPERLFTPGLYARVQFSDNHEYQALLIDDKAIMTDQERRYVFVLTEGNIALRKDIVIGRMHEGLRVIESGLDTGDVVIISGLQRIFYPGAPVNPTMVAMNGSPLLTPITTTQGAL
ncbi:efflux RND transporter periplasmic adaptor subunit [Serratia sp. MMO-24]|uniref:efflux RND transporter periplasmic adaptor subunit n=1 Tax=Serratia sp. MMO-24 TaxID=3081677 RepID=UPI0030764B00